MQRNIEFDVQVPQLVRVSMTTITTLYHAEQAVDLVLDMPEANRSLVTRIALAGSVCGIVLEKDKRATCYVFRHDGVEWMPVIDKFGCDIRFEEHGMPKVPGIRLVEHRV